jgi:hypothetical protein
MNRDQGKALGLGILIGLNGWYCLKVFAWQKNAASMVGAMTFAVPVSFFESISIIFGGTGLIFEGLTKRGGCRHEKFC